MVLILTAVIVGILFATVKPQKIIQDKNTKYRYAAAYDALNLAVYDLTAKEATDPFANITYITAAPPVPPSGPAAVPSSTTVPSSPPNANRNNFTKLCSGLASYLNTTSENCSSSALKTSNAIYMKDESFDFRDLTPNLISNNGMKFYISPLIMDTKKYVWNGSSYVKQNGSYYNAANPEFIMKFFMVYVDINGGEHSNKPHTIKYDPSEKNSPDVFAFAVIPTGDAIPIGVAEYNQKFLQTRIAYNENHSTYYSQFYSFHEAKHAAWNWYTPEASNIQFKEKISFTYNDYIKEILERGNSQLYKFLESGNFDTTYSDGQFEKCVPTEALTPFDLCRITVDTPNYGATH